MKRIILAAFAALLLMPGVRACEAKSTSEKTSLATIESTSSFDFVSKINDESYRVTAYIPEGKPPTAGFPTLYVLDGSNLFGTFVNAVHNEGFVQEIEPAVVVGIDGGPGEQAADRTFDFTPLDLTDNEKKIVVDLGSKPRFGGYEKFLRVIQEEIKPRIAHLATIDGRRDILFGWSLGGQFVVHTMLAHPATFSTYIALSPSLFRSDKFVFTEISEFKKTVAVSGQRVSLWLGVGSLEQEISPGMARWPLDQEKFGQELTYANMVGNVLDLTAAIRPFFEKHEFPIVCRVFEGETHNSVPWAAINPALRFALASSPIK